eukprot:GHVU01104055.1.p1 GENE.GHVU01104055.1~~GHVU01104055.1.p1  ORF type:complete len:103 (+),score=6.38 GHVU01104055.1:787-1095(+)
MEPPPQRQELHFDDRFYESVALVAAQTRRDYRRRNRDLVFQLVLLRNVRGCFRTCILEAIDVTFLDRLLDRYPRPLRRREWTQPDADTERAPATPLQPRPTV